VFGIGMPELIVIFVIALVVFGPAELPKLAKSLGRIMAEFKRTSDDLMQQIHQEIDAVGSEETKPVDPSLDAAFPSTDSPGTTPPAESAAGTGTGGEVAEASTGDASEPGSVPAEGMESASQPAAPVAEPPDAGTESPDAAGAASADGADSRPDPKGEASGGPSPPGSARPETPAPAGTGPDRGAQGTATS
jgi:sec-independent protein translocase protein TatA